MIAFLQQVFTLLTTEAGSLTYHLVLAFAIAGSLPAALHQSRIPGVRQPGRMAIGLGGLLLCQLILFASTGLVWQGLFNPGDLLPLIDRGVILLSFVFVIWLWAFPEPSQKGDAAAGFLALSVTSFMVVVGIWWFDQPVSTPFAGAWVDKATDYLALGLAILGSLFLMIRRTPGWGLGLAMLVGLGLGHLMNLAIPTPDSDYSGAIRLTQMAAYPLLLALPMRQAVVKSIELAVRGASSSPNLQVTSPDHRNIPLDIKTLRALMQVSADGNLESISPILAKVVAHTLLADVCLLVSPPDVMGNMSVLGGYDLIRERTLPKISLGKDLTPTLGIALQNKQILRLPASSGSVDMVYLGHRLSVQRVGHLMAVPIRLNQGGSVGGIVILSPYTLRAWNDEDQNRLVDLAETTASYLQQHESFRLSKEELQQLHHAFQTVKDEKDSMLVERQALFERIQDLQRKASEEQQQTEDLTSMREELRLALQEIAFLNAGQNPSNQPATGSELTNDEFAEIFAVAEELRQPMSSLVGYTDVLLAESHGILGDRQRKIVERIRVANERMTRLLDELISNLNIEEKQYKQVELQAVDLAGVLQKAINETETARQANQIGLRIKLPERLPLLEANPGALQKGLHILLSNACRVSTPDTSVFLQARVRAGEGDQDYILLQISDTGKGIPPDELPYIFSHVSGDAGYEGESNGTGLSGVKQLIESFGGRILVDSDPGFGATFSLLLPVKEV